MGTPVREILLRGNGTREPGGLIGDHTLGEGGVAFDRSDLSSERYRWVQRDLGRLKSRRENSGHPRMIRNVTNRDHDICPNMECYDIPYGTVHVTILQRCGMVRMENNVSCRLSPRTGTYYGIALTRVHNWKSAVLHCSSRCVDAGDQNMGTYGTWWAVRVQGIQILLPLCEVRSARRAAGEGRRIPGCRVAAVLLLRFKIKTRTYYYYGGP